MPIINNTSQIKITPEKYAIICSEIEVIESIIALQKRMRRDNIDPQRLIEQGTQLLMHRSNAGVLFAIKRNKKMFWIQHVAGQTPQWKSTDKALTAQAKSGQLQLETANIDEYLTALLQTKGEEL